MNCKLIIFMAYMLGLCTSAFSQEVGDTVASFDNASNIVVTQTGTLTKVEAEVPSKNGLTDFFEYEVNLMENDSTPEIEFGNDWGLNLPYYSTSNGTSRKHSKISRNVVGFEHGFMGWRFNYHDKSHVKNCYEVGIKQIIGLAWSKGKRNSSTFSIGFGFGSQRFLAQEGYAYVKEANKITFAPVTGNGKVKHSHMDMRTLYFPVLYKQAFAKHFNFSIGGTVNLNYYASAITEINYGDIKIKNKYKGLQQNLLTADLFVSLGNTEGFGIYFTWSPMNLFKKCYGPELKGWAIGLDLFSF